MNVRIEEQNLRFKITEEELKALLDGHPVHARVDLLDKAFVATINPTGRGEAMEPKLVMDDNEVYLTLLIPPARVQELSDLGRSRAGLQEEAGALSINIQVDLREDSRKVGKR